MLLELARGRSKMAKQKRPRARPPQPAVAAGAKANSAGDYLIFVSHATADKWVAKIICEKLEAAGAKTFRDDRDIAGGDRIPEEIIRQITRCKEFVVLLTPRSVDRPWVLLEVGMALRNGRRTRIVPILYHVGVDPIPEMIKIGRRSISTSLRTTPQRSAGRHGGISHERDV